MAYAAPEQLTTLIPIKNADHYFKGQPELRDEACQQIGDWVRTQLGSTG